MIFCTNCGAEADDQSLFCEQCGRQLVAALPVACSNCGRRARANARFCAACGTSLIAAGTFPPGVRPPPAPEPAEPTPSLELEPAPAAPEPALLEDEAGPAIAEAPVPFEESTATDLPEPALPWGESARTPAEPFEEEGTAEDQAAPGTRFGRDAAIRPPRQKPAGITAREWAASRQADILLYLGAFLLVAAALLFVSSRGEELSPELRVALLLAYTIGFTVAGLLAQRNPRIREAGMVFLAIGALITPLNFLLIYTELLEPRDVSQDVVWLIGSLYSAVFYGALWRRGYGRLYAVPTGLSVISAWAALSAVIELPGEWLGPWWITFLLTTTVALHRIRRYRVASAWVMGALIALVFIAQLVASDLGSGDHGRVPLPISLGLITAWFAFTGYALRSAGVLPWGATAAIATGVAAMRAANLEADWWAYSPLAMGFIAVYSRRWWAHWRLDIGRLGWAYAAACGLAPIALLTEYETGAHGAVSFLLGAAVLASVTWRDTVDGVRLFETARPGTPTTVAERTLFGWIGFVLVLIGVAYAQREFAIEEPDTAWAYLAIGLTPIAILARVGRRWQPALLVLIPPAVLAMLVSLPEPDTYPGHIAVLLGAPTIAYLGAFATTRRWPITLVAAITGTFAAAAAWDALEWPLWTIAITYSAFGVLLFALLTPRRTYESALAPLIVTILSWGFVVLGPSVAFGGLLPVDEFDAVVKASAEYRTGLYLLLLIAPLLAFEGWRFRNWTVTAAATTLAALVVAPLWNSYGWPGWTLALAYLAVGAVRFVTMSAVRTYRNEPAQLPIVFLSWGLVLAAPLTAWIALANRLSSDGGTAVEMVEYRTFIGVVVAHVPLLLLDATRLRARWALVTASVVAMAGVLLTIAAFQFDDVQAYTVPVGLYLIAFGLIVRQSAPVFARHMMLHELVLLGGVATLLGPQVQLGLEPDGAGWGGIIMLEGLVFLLVGLVLGSRWLTASGVIAISGVAIRWLAVNTGDTIPYWLSLGGVGMALLVLGTALLLARDRWIAIRDASVAWWERSATLRGVGIETPVVLAPVAVMVIATIASSIEHWTALAPV